MADLLDIAPSTATEVVKINGQRLTVRSLGADAIASLAARFPKIIGMFFAGINIAEIGPKFIEEFGGAVGPIIAAGCGHLRDEKTEQYASTAFLLEDQLKLVIAIIGITFPNGFGFFEELVKRFTRAATGEEAKTYKNPLNEIALAITALIRRGFPPEYAMTLSPRQIVAYLEFSNELDRISSDGNAG
jgi:hypothetical protein